MKKTKTELKHATTLFLLVALLVVLLPSNLFLTVEAQEAVLPSAGLLGNIWQDLSFEPYLMTDYPSKDYLTWNTTFGLYTMDKASYLMSLTDRQGVLQVSKAMFWINTTDTDKVLNPDKILSNYEVLVQNNTCFKVKYAVTTDKEIVGWLTVEYDFFKDSNPKISVSYENISLTTFNIVWVLLPTLKYLEISDSETVDYTTVDTVKSSASKQDKACRIGETSTSINWTSWLSVLWDDSEGTSILYAGTEKVFGGKGLTVVYPTNMAFIDPSIIFTTVSVTSVHTCPLDEHTFVIVYHDEANDNFSFQIWDMNGTRVLAETDVDTTSGGTMQFTSIGVSAFNSTTFVIGWYDKTDGDATFAVYNKAGTKLSGPTDADEDIGTASYSVQVSCFNSTYFVIGWYDNTDNAATFAIYDSSSNLITAPVDADTVVGASNSVSVSAFNSTTFVIGWFDATDQDATFAVYDTAGTQIGSTIDADTKAGSSCKSVSVSTLNSTYFVIGWSCAYYGRIYCAVYNSAGTLKTATITVDSTSGGNSYSAQVSALNSTAFVISRYSDYSPDYDLAFATYLSDGTVVAALTIIESWPTTHNYPFRYQSPCSQETANNIKIYGDNWIIAYANTTSQAILQAFYPNGTALYIEYTGPPYATLYPTADGDVVQAMPDYNAGADAFMIVDTKTNQNTRNFLKFNLSSLPDDANITLAKLRSNCYEINDLVAGVSDVQARRVAEDWEEDEITWNNQPAYGDVEDTKVPFVGWVEWNVTAWVQNAWDGDKNVRLCLKCVTEDYDGTARRSKYRTKEYDGDDPELYIEYTVEGENNAPVNDVCDSDATFDVDVYGWSNMTVSDADLVADLKTVDIQVTTSDSKVFTLRWTQATNVFSEQSDPDGICTLDISGSTRINIDSDTDKIAFKFKISVAAQKGACNVQATTTDDQDATDIDTYTAEFSINFYCSITVNDGSHSWTGLSPGDSQVLVNGGGGSDGDIDITITANDAFSIQAKGNGPLTSGSNTIPLANVEMHASDLGSAISLTTSYQNIPGLTSQTRGVDLAKSFKLWLTVPNPQEDGDYTYNLSIQVVET